MVTCRPVACAVLVACGAHLFAPAQSFGQENLRDCPHHNVIGECPECDSDCGDAKEYLESSGGMWASEVEAMDCAEAKDAARRLGWQPKRAGSMQEFLLNGRVESLDPLSQVLYSKWQLWKRAGLEDNAAEAWANLIYHMEESPHTVRAGLGYFGRGHDRYHPHATQDCSLLKPDFQASDGDFDAAGHLQKILAESSACPICNPAPAAPKDQQAGLDGVGGPPDEEFIEDAESLGPQTAEAIASLEQALALANAERDQYRASGDHRRAAGLDAMIQQLERDINLLRSESRQRSAGRSQGDGFDEYGPADGAAPPQSHPDHLATQISRFPTSREVAASNSKLLDELLGELVGTTAPGSATATAVDTGDSLVDTILGRQFDEDRDERIADTTASGFDALRTPARSLVDVVLDGPIGDARRPPGPSSTSTSVLIPPSRNPLAVEAKPSDADASPRHLENLPPELLWSRDPTPPRFEPARPIEEVFIAIKSGAEPADQISWKPMVPGTGDWTKVRLVSEPRVTEVHFPADGSWRLVKYEAGVKSNSGNKAAISWYIKASTRGRFESTDQIIAAEYSNLVAASGAEFDDDPRGSYPGNPGLRARSRIGNGGREPPEIWPGLAGAGVEWLTDFQAVQEVSEFHPVTVFVDGTPVAWWPARPAPKLQDLPD